jgi:hypothetical protein
MRYETETENAGLSIRDGLERDPMVVAAREIRCAFDNVIQRATFRHAVSYAKCQLLAGMSAAINEALQSHGKLR